MLEGGSESQLKSGLEDELAGDIEDELVGDVEDELVGDIEDELVNEREPDEIVMEVGSCVEVWGPHIGHSNTPIPPALYLLMA
jgi:hypothetical protein